MDWDLVYNGILHSAAAGAKVSHLFKEPPSPAEFREGVGRVSEEMLERPADEAWFPSDEPTDDANTATQPDPVTRDD